MMRRNFSAAILEEWDVSRPAHSAATLRVLPSLRSVASALLPVLIGLAAPALRAQSSVPYTPVSQSNGIQSEWRTVKEMPGQWRTDVRLTNLSTVPKFVWVSYRFTCPDGRVVRGGLADDAGFTLRDHKSDFFYPACGGPGPRSISISYSCVVDTPPGVDGYATCVAIKTGQPTPQQRQQEEQRKAALAQQEQQLAQANQQRRDAAAQAAAIQRQQQEQAQQANLAAQRARDQQQQQARAALQQ
jgi:hypothetical protein